MGALAVQIAGLIGAFHDYLGQSTGQKSVEVKGYISYLSSPVSGSKFSAILEKDNFDPAPEG
jgi:hypothetical protein